MDKMLLPLFLLGVIAMTAQASFIREVLATYTGGELIFGSSLLFWLLWTSIGSGILGKYIKYFKNPKLRFSELLPWYGILGYTGVVIIGNTPALIGLTPGELVPYDLQLVFVCLAFLPFNILGGFIFVLGAKAFNDTTTPSVGRAYIAESLGAALAGAIISLILVNLLSTYSIAMICPVLAISAGVILKIRNVKPYRILWIFFPIALLTVIYMGNKSVSDYYYKGQNLIEELNTKYGRLRVTQKDEQITFYSNTSILFSTPDIETSEYSAHIPMLVSTEPHHVLVLGGCYGGVINEILKYNTVEKITCVELDPGVIKLAKKHLTEYWSNNPKIETVLTDGRAFLQTTHEKFDVIIMNMPPPLSGITNRYYTSDFFRLTSSRLSDKGILGFSLSGSENYISDDLANFLSSIRNTLRTAFPSVVALPGIKCSFLAGNSPDMFNSLGWENLSLKRKELGIETLYVRDYFLHNTMSPMKMDFIKNALESVESPIINSDMKPTGYFLRTILQGSLDFSNTTNALKSLISPYFLGFFILLVISLLSLFVVIPEKGIFKRPIIGTVISVGITEISLELLAIMAYQSIFGFLYSRIALLTGSYMAGMALGAWISNKLVEKQYADVKHLVITQAGIAIIPLIWIGFLFLHSIFPGKIPLMELGFFSLTTLAGLSGGFQFPIADYLYRKSISYDESGLGVVYGVDLAGSSIGALITASIMIPVIGMFPVLIFLSALNIITAFALWLRKNQIP